MSTAQDRVEILDLLSRYNQAADLDGNGDAFANTFTDDGIFESSSGEYVARGRQQLADMVKPNAIRDHGTRHWISNVAINVDGDRATMRAYLMALRISIDGACTISSTGVYHDQLRRVDGEWKFVHRRLEFDRDVTLSV